LPARASSVTNNPIASIDSSSCVERVSGDDQPLLTSVSKLHIGNGLVRISAGMVGILLNSCSGENDDARLDDEILTEPWPGRVRIIGGEQSAEPGARS
jgi:hypothetical protein